MRLAWCAACAVIFPVYAATAEPDLSGIYFAAQGFATATPEMKTPIVPTVENVRTEMSWTEIDILAGFNLTHGPVLFGMEGRLSIPLNHGEGRHHFPIREITPGEVLSSCTGCAPTAFEMDEIQTVRSFFSPGFPRRQEFISIYQLEEDAVATAAFRIGHQLDRVLLFGRIGAGAAFVEERQIFDDSRSIYCPEHQRRSVASGGNITTIFLRCTISNPGDIRIDSKSYVAPVILAGVGAEYHWDRIFVRGDAEFQHTFLSPAFGDSPSGLSKWRIGAGAGLKLQ